MQGLSNRLRGITCGGIVKDVVHALSLFDTYGPDGGGLAATTPPYTYISLTPLVTIPNGIG